MGFPDHIERTLDVEHAPAAVWAALTTAEGLASWLGSEASIELRPGGTAYTAWIDGPRADMRVERVEDLRVFGFTWRIDGMPMDDPRRTYVEFTLEPLGTGTRVRVVERGFAQLPDDQYRKGYDAHAVGWTRELAELVDHLDAG